MSPIVPFFSVNRIVYAVISLKVRLFRRKLITIRPIIFNNISQKILNFEFLCLYYNEWVQENKFQMFTNENQ